jgi:hypothetical protein
MAASGNLMTDIIGRFKEMAINLVLSQLPLCDWCFLRLALALHVCKCFGTDALFDYAFYGFPGLFVPVL